MHGAGTPDPTLHVMSKGQALSAGSRHLSMSQRLSPVWFIVAMLVTSAVVASIAWLVHGTGQGPASDDFTVPGPLPVLTVGEVLRAEELPAGTATVTGRLDVVLASAGELPAALALSSDDGDGELLVVPAEGTRIAPAVLRAGEGARVRAVGQLRVATATNPPRGGEGHVTAEVLGEPMLVAAAVSLEGAEDQRRSAPQQRARTTAR